MPDLTSPIRAEMMQYLFHQNKVELHPKALQVSSRLQLAVHLRNALVY